MYWKRAWKVAVLCCSDDNSNPPIAELRICTDTLRSSRIRPKIPIQNSLLQS
jgi:hypothetical protein